MTERAVTIDTVQGIGDIFWTYQKLAPYFDRIHLRILHIANDQVQKRAAAFCRMLPKVGDVKYVMAKPQEYTKLATGTFPIADVIRRAGTVGRAQPYAVNAPLERGIHLRDIDPGMLVLDRVDLHGQTPDDPPREPYLCLYVAGSKVDNLWSPVRWAMAATRLCARLGVTQVRMIGAGWDADAQAAILPHLVPLQVESHVGAGMSETLDIIRRAAFFFGYQSGLNVLAENYDTPQLMVYFDRLSRMQYTWVKPASIRTRFHAMLFGDAPSARIDALPDTLFPPAEVTP
jgi:hypothetical protein